MTIQLTPCPFCARHVRSDAATCPFCERERERERDGDRRHARAVAIAIVTASVLATTPAMAEPALDGGAPAAIGDADTDAADGAVLDAAAFAEEWNRQEWNRPVPLYGVPPPPHSCGCETTRVPTSNAAMLAAAAMGVALLARRRRDDD